MTEAHPQLTIPLKVPTLNRLEDFDTGANAELLTRIRELAAGAATPGLWLWGPAGSGRSHLLQGACQATQARGGHARYLPLAGLPRNPELLEGTADLVAVDDVDTWLGERELEIGLMGLYQTQLDARRALLLSAGRGPAGLPFALADLESRCRALPSFAVAPPDDAGLRRILTVKARERGLVLSDGVLDYWLHRGPRSLPALLAQLTVLDDRALAEQRRITVPFVKAELAL
ncbi:MAG: DnaA regulatory inactivator Hda [Pseudomonadales bacterium]